MQQLGVRSLLAVPLRVGEVSRGVLVLLSSRPSASYADGPVFVEELAGTAALALDNARLLPRGAGGAGAHRRGGARLGQPAAHAAAAAAPAAPAGRWPPGREKVREGLGTALRQTQQLGQLLHNLLDLSRLSSGKLALDVAPVDLAELAIRHCRWRTD